LFDFSLLRSSFLLPIYTFLMLGYFTKNY
jgi:hypothetical protein